MTEHLTAAQFQQLAKAERKQRQSREYEQHVSYVQYIDAMLPNNCGFHIPNGEYRDKRTAAKLKRMGTKAGVVDFCLPYGGGRTLWMEFKVEGEKPRKSQKDWIKKMHDRSHTVAIIYSLDDIRNAFKFLGIITRESI